MKRLPTAAVLVIMTALLGCSPAGDTERAEIAVFGTQVEIVARSAPPGTFNQAVRAIDRDMQELHSRWHAWQPGKLVEINRAIAAGKAIALPEDMAAVIRHAAELELASNGLFNPAIGRLLALWGFHSSAFEEGPPPPAGAIDELIENAPSLSDLSIAEGRLSSRNPAVQLDFGAYIKGYAVERALATLERAGIRHAIVNAGGDLGVIGTRGDGPWRVAIRHPDGDGGEIVGILSLATGEFAFTSGNYLRYRRSEGIRYGHILNPHTGYPSDHIASVTVIHSRGASADAAATALAVASDPEWQQTAAALGVTAALRIDEDGRIEMTPDMERRIELPDYVLVSAIDRAKPLEPQIAQIDTD